MKYRRTSWILHLTCHLAILLQLDPKEIAKARAKAVKAEAKAAQIAKETRGMQKMSAFFKKPAAKAAA